jgi:16S rRNA (guanine966-N2)-methyltransferase
MRIITGNLKGRKYTGNIPESIRPTTDSTREAIFNVLNNYTDFDGISVLDLCAGTGFMGFEAISRGADNCVFIEKSPKNARLIDSIAMQFKLDKGMYSIGISDAVKYLKNIDNKMIFDLIIIDPPYSTNLLQNCIDLLSEKDILAENGIIAAEHGNLTELILPDNIETITKKTFGTTVVDFLAKK